MMGKMKTPTAQASQNASRLASFVMPSPSRADLYRDHYRDKSVAR
jgi:hypothetical protein